jgi:ribose transport system substrate-binding protein
LTTDNVQAGRVAADILAERIQKTYADAEGDVALITPMPGVAALDQRAKGFKEQIAAKYGALNIVAEKVANGQATTARDIMAGIIAAYPELRGVFASNLITAKGAGEAVAENKTNRTGDKINLVGFDSDDELVKFLQDGTIAALCRTRSAWAMRASRPRSPPRRANRCWPTSLPAQSSLPRPT